MPEWPLAETPKICHLFGQCQKEGEDRQGAVAETTRQVCAPGNPFAQDSPRWLMDSPALRGDRRLPSTPLFRAQGSKIHPELHAMIPGADHGTQGPCAPPHLITGKGRSSNSEPQWD